jgi:hypothetical protein
MTMQRTTIALVFTLIAFTGGASAEAQGTQPQPKCLKAEVNSVTGQVLCIDPLGAPVEPLPPEAVALGAELHAGAAGDVSAPGPRLAYGLIIDCGDVVRS